jgi:multidrug efflux system membrane fusion protein
MNICKMSVIFSLLLLLLSACGDKQEEEKIIRPVRYLEVYATGGGRARTFTGVAQAGMESKLSFKIAGTVQNVLVQVGDKIKAGQLITQLDPKDYELQVQQAEAALNQAQAQARNASANYDRIRVLFENSNASRSQLDGARAANESAEAAVRAAEKQLELAKLQLSYTRLKAPTNGAIATVNIEENENIQPGLPVVILTAGSDIEVKISIPEILISRVEEGTEVSVLFDALPDQNFSATITEVGVATTGLGTTYPVTARLLKQDPRIRPGMAASVTINFRSGDERERILVPSQAVLEDREGRFVYVVEPLSAEVGFGIVHRRPVVIGELTAEGIEIFQGLTDGDRVVTAGVSRISDSLKVRL